MEKPTKQQLSIQEWETLLEDFQFSPSRREKWLLQHPSPSLLELALASVVRKEFSVKIQVIVFLEENFDVLVGEESVGDALGSLVESLRAVVQSPVDGVSVTYSVKEQMIVSVASIFVAAGAVEAAPRHLEGLVELLLTIINRPNHGPDRQTRAVACECLRELERANPCLLVEITPHLWTLCQNERTHASQSYLLLLTSVILNLIRSKIHVPILATSLPLIPFNIPVSLVSTAANNNNNNSSGRDLNLKEIRRVVAFLLEQPQILTPCGMMEFMDMIMEVGSALELQVSLLKVQFSGLLYSYDPILSHVVLTLYSRFSDAFEGQEREIARRLVLKSKEMQQHLVFRLLALHWLLGFPVKKESVKKRSIMQMVSSLYPTVFDPLALKALKLDLLAYTANCLDFSKSEEVPAEIGSSRLSAVTLFEEGLICVSSFKWLPLWSSETMVAFHAIHKFLIGAVPHSSSDASSAELLLDSTIFRRLQNFIVNTSMEFRRLVPVLVSFVDRLLGCHSHRWLGELLLQTLDERLLPKLANNHHLASYFPIFNRIAKNESIPPRSLLELLTSYISTLVENHTPDTGLKSWSHGSKVLGICRTMLMHHLSSRVFILLSHLLAFTCQFFPDLEIRDNARIYLRMLVCVPGKKLRYILNLGEQLPGVSPSPHLSSFFQSQTPQTFRDKKSRDISSYIHLDRLKPLLIKQSWSLTIPTFGTENNAPYYGGIRDGEPPTGPEADKEVESCPEVQSIPESERIDAQKEPLRVMNSRDSEVLQILRRHFTGIPDFRHMTGLKIRIPCTLRFESEPFNRIWGIEKSTKSSHEMDSLPALYAIVVSFSSSAPYGSIPKFHVPFLLGQPSHQGDSLAQKNQLDIVPSQNGSDQVVEDEENENFKASVVIELEPREPMPGLIDVGFEANGEDGQIIQGSLQSIMVGIEDMFQKATLPPDILKDSAPQYYSSLFSALWEACGDPANIGREIFPLKGGKGVATINGTQSVKLLNVSSDFLIQSVELHLTPFVASVIGHPLVDIVKDGNIISDTVFKDGEFFESEVLPLKYTNDTSDGHSPFDISRGKLGNLHVLIFLPPRYHLLFQMEVSDISTLVRIRTDHWPCLAYVDDYLEALFFDTKS
ncbi:hypothetical protein H6P81_018150 [Aristolochia fimbriata]|uniref:AP-5 complex subunit beta-1 n=1 Tax=Aristolochia fimbriata TaxID=158543 RepID=A0AAV7E1P0_ARIFI|nr:hypothetical protein H6P81_018150 [Aristolochia fimbriata]